MADDAIFNPPLGAVELPTVQADPKEIVGQIAAFLQLNGPTDLVVSPACARRESEDLWIPTVIVNAGEDASWIMSPDTARAAAVHVGQNRVVEACFGQAPKVGLMFWHAANTAEDMAAGKYPFHKREELN